MHRGFAAHFYRCPKNTTAAANSCNRFIRQKHHGCRFWRRSTLWRRLFFFKAFNQLSQNGPDQVVSQWQWSELTRSAGDNFEASNCECQLLEGKSHHALTVAAPSLASRSWFHHQNRSMQGSRTYGKPVRPNSFSGHGRALKELGATCTDVGFFGNHSL